MSRISIAERLRSRLEVTDSGCHEWTGATDRRGYGCMNRARALGVIKTHRLAWELVNGPIPDGLCVLHRCDNPPCCNVEHLFLGTQADNHADMVAKGRHYHPNPTHCPAEHEFTSANTYVTPKGYKVCRICQLGAQARHRLKNKAARAARRNNR